MSGSWCWLLARFYYSLPHGISSSRIFLPAGPLKQNSPNFFSMGLDSKRASTETVKPPLLRPGSHPVSLLPQWISQSKLQGQTWSREGEIDSTSCWEEEWPRHIAEGRAEWEPLQWPSVETVRPSGEKCCHSPHLRENPGDRKVLLKVGTEVSDRGACG